MTLINLKLTSIQLNAIELALQNKVEEMTDHYDSDDKHALFHTLDAQIAVEDARIDADGDDGCERSPCPYCIDEPDVPTVALGYVVERLVDAFEQDDPEAEVKRFLEELFGNVGAHKSGSQTVAVDYVLDRLNDIKGDGEFDPDEFFRFIDEIEKVVGVHKHD